MQIHELQPFTGQAGSSDYLAIDNGTQTKKISADNLGVSTQMTQAEAEAGTVTASRVVSPKVLHDYVQNYTTSNFVDISSALVELNTSAAAGTVDGDLYRAIQALGWGSEVIV